MNLNGPWFEICVRSKEFNILSINDWSIQRDHQHTDREIIIGDRGHYGKASAGEASALLREWALSKLNLQKLDVGDYSGNIGSR